DMTVRTIRLLACGAAVAIVALSYRQQTHRPRRPAPAPVVALRDAMRATIYLSQPDSPEARGVQAGIHDPQRAMKWLHQSAGNPCPAPSSPPDYRIHLSLQGLQSVILDYVSATGQIGKDKTWFQAPEEFRAWLVDQDVPYQARIRKIESQYYGILR